MDKREKLQSMLDAIIDDKNDQAQVDFHQYLQNKMQSALKGEVTDNTSQHASEE